MEKIYNIPNYPDPYWILQAAKENKASADFLYNESIKIICVLKMTKKNLFQWIQFQESFSLVYENCVF